MSNYETEFLKVLERAGSDEQQVALWKVLCKRCGNIFITRGSTIRAGYIQTCGCIHSQGETNIAKLLIENNIEYATQYTFPNLIGPNGGSLRFDFAIFKNGILSHLIEYNGKQHYEKVSGCWGDSYETLIECDKRKKEYCFQKNIPLIVIKYDEKYDINTLIQI